MVFPERMDGLDIHPNRKVVAFAAGYYYCMLLLSSGKVIRYGQVNSEPFIGQGYFTVIDCPVRIKSLACGSNHTVGKQKFFPYLFASRRISEIWSF